MPYAFSSPRLAPGVFLTFSADLLGAFVCSCCSCLAYSFFPCHATKRSQEVEELRQKLQEVELGTALSQADSNFLQRELEEKEADIGE